MSQPQELNATESQSRDGYSRKGSERIQAGDSGPGLRAGKSAHSIACGEGLDGKLWLAHWLFPLCIRYP